MKCSTTAQTGGPRGWVRTAFLAAGFALLLTSTAQPAAAAEQDPMQVATDQAANCEAMGGEATVDVYRTPRGDLNSTSVSCKGGVADGVTCDNGYYGTYCTSPDIPAAEPTDWAYAAPVRVVEPLDDGPAASPVGVNETLEEESAN